MIAGNEKKSKKKLRKIWKYKKPAVSLCRNQTTNNDESIKVNIYSDESQKVLRLH